MRVNMLACRRVCAFEHRGKPFFVWQAAGPVLFVSPCSSKLLDRSYRPASFLLQGLLQSHALTSRGSKPALQRQQRLQQLRPGSTHWLS